MYMSVTLSRQVLDFMCSLHFTHKSYENSISDRLHEVVNFAIVVRVMGVWGPMWGHVPRITLLPSSLLVQCQNTKSSHLLSLRARELVFWNISSPFLLDWWTCRILPNAHQLGSILAILELWTDNQPYKKNPIYRRLACRIYAYSGKCIYTAGMVLSGFCM